MKRTAEALWKGNGLEGKGELTTQSGVFDGQPYSFTTRFKNEDGKEGTNPEELIAAAHAGCFNMALSFQLTGAGHAPDTLHTKATVEMDTSGADFFISGITLHLKAIVPGISKEQFEELAEKAKNNCPISTALKTVPLTLETEFSN
ncbi:MAG: OsmC family protein [Candidatus Kapaibacteriales bacterium]